MKQAIVKRNQEIFERVNEQLKGKQKLDKIFVYNMEPGDNNFFLVTGAKGSFIYSSAIVSPDGSSKLLVSELEEGDAKRNRLEYVVLTKKYSDTLPEVLGNVRTVGINGELINYKLAKSLAKNYRLVDISEQLKDARVQKTREELASIKKACNITCDVASRIPEYIKPGMKEIELAARLEYDMKTLGGEGLAFETIVASGENSALPHHKTGNREFKEGDFVLVDFGCKVNELCSDLTRTYVLGKASDLQKELYYHILKVQDNALNNLKVGVESHKLWEAADKEIKDFFTKQNMQGKMGHGLGHSIGYFTHDGIRITKRNPKDPVYKIPAGLITTIEPGGYCEGFGGVRIEDNVRVMKKGLEILTYAPKERLIEIPVR